MHTETAKSYPGQATLAYSFANKTLRPLRENQNPVIYLWHMSETISKNRSVRWKNSDERVLNPQQRIPGWPTLRWTELCCATNSSAKKTQEYLAAYKENNLTEIADALGDQLYILCGTTSLNTGCNM